MFKEKVFSGLMSMQDIDGDGLDIVKLGRVIADVTRSSVSQKRWMAETKKKAEKALENIEEKLKAQKLDPEALRIVREEVYGII
jgi:hypothetical protein